MQSLNYMMPSERNMSSYIKSLALTCFCYTLLSFSIPSVTATDTISANQSVSDGETIVSANGNFELGFFSPGSSQNRYLGIRYRKIPSHDIVWIANRDTPINTTTFGMLKFDGKANLVVVNSSDGIIWSSNLSRLLRNPVAQLLDTGNLVIRDESSSGKISWQSFDYTGNTLLAGAKVGKDLSTGLERALNSWKSEDDPSPGLWKFELDTDGFPQLFLKKNGSVSYRFGPWNGVRFSGLPAFGSNPAYSNVFVINDEEIYYMYELLDDSVSMRIMMDSQGLAKRYSWINRTQDWATYLTYQADDCDRYARCGPYGSCSMSTSPPCDCLEGFEPKFAQAWENGDWTSGCVRKVNLSCGNGDGFKKFSGMKVPDTRKSWFNLSMNIGECRDMCLRNCNCTAYTNTDVKGGGSGCLLWFNDLIDIGENKDNQQVVYVRMPASETGGKSNPGVKRLVLIIGIPGVLALTAVIGSLIYVFKYKKQRTEGKRRLNVDSVGANSNGSEDLPLLDFRTIANATNNFSMGYKIGEGGFGPVYKGTLEGGQTIAVKRLSESSRQGIDEFRNEVSFIAKLQHRNLVKLLGWSTEGRERMLIYEYMSKKSLDLYIFDEEQRKLLDWTTRYNIIYGIARGLLYLHHDSRLRIIHRDLKASNVLLDDEMNPRISDFGLARCFGGSETQANTTKVVGTYGYMSPEYAIEGIFSTKSDVYSFGVLLLEIVSGMRNRHFGHTDHDLYLTGHAWRLHQEGKFGELIDRFIVESCDQFEIIRAIEIGLLCVQQYPEDRPSMLSVVQMLSGETEVFHPKQPGFFDENRVHKLASKELFDSNRVTVTFVSPR